MMKDGRAYKLYLEEVQKTIQEAKTFTELDPYAQEMGNAMEMLQNVTSHLMRLAGKGNPDLFLADATIYLDFFSIICIAWQWLVQAIAVWKALNTHPSGKEADFYEGKFYTFRYFFNYELPKIDGPAKRLMNGDGLTVDMQSNLFYD
jgi:butyryl-CoA dehydrogenase